MKKYTIFALTLITLLLAACGDSPPSDAALDSDSPMSETEGTAQESDSSGLMDKTKELGQATWDKTKEVTSNTLETVSETSQEIYEATKDKASEAGDAISDKSSEIYQSAKDSTKDAYESAKETGTKLIQDVTQPEE